jgi:hypothetical protein
MKLTSLLESVKTSERSAINEARSNSFKFEGTINLQGSDIKELPDNLNVYGDLILAGIKSLRKLPKNLNVSGDLDITDTNVDEIPEGLTLTGTFSFANTPLSEYYNAKEEKSGEIKKMIQKDIVSKGGDISFGIDVNF